MVYQGNVHNGVIVLPAGVELPEGASVNVELLAKAQVQDQNSTKEDPLLNMSQFAVDMGIPDLAVNIDHYLYGHPKVTDGR
jgi:hypothetical protein